MNKKKLMKMYRSFKTGLEFENISFVDEIFNNQMEMKNCYVDDNPHFPSLQS